jgi:hypothetical protein
MTVSELVAKLTIFKDRGGNMDLLIVVRCQWEDVAPDGVCFELRNVTVELDHDTGVPFVAFDCDQDTEDDAA